jgi:hypothetical protein
MDVDTLSRFLREMVVGTPVAGTQEGKEYKFGGISEYSGTGRRYAQLRGELVTVLLSGERKRPKIVLFLAPLLFFVNATDEELGFGHLPEAYFRKYCQEESPQIPNLSEYEFHYKALARHIRRVTSRST